MFEDKYSVTVIVDKKDDKNPTFQYYEMYSYSFETVEKLLELIDALEGAEG